MNEAKLGTAVGGKETRPMTEEEIQTLFQSPAGFLGPLNVAWAKGVSDGDKPLLFVDEALKGRRNLISGANKRITTSKTSLPAKPSSQPLTPISEV